MFDAILTCTYWFNSSGMPTDMDDDMLDDNILAAESLANLQPGRQIRPHHSLQSVLPDPGAPAHNRISREDLLVFKEKFPHLNDFSDEFLQSRTMDELLRIESTSLRIRDSERARETEDKLATNKAALASKFTEVSAGRDNRWSVLHPSRYLPGAACSAVKQFITAREVLGLTSPPAVGCYDLNSVGMGGFVTNRGWLELGTMGSTKMKVALYNINNPAKSTSVRSSSSDDSPDMKDVPEFVLALRTLRTAAQFVCPWNFSFLALENFLIQKEFFKDELKHDDNPARTLCQFSDFVLAENANHWRDGTGFLTTGELKAYWDSFIGARPQQKPSAVQQSVASVSKPAAQQGQKQPRDRKRKYPFVDICHKYNFGNCPKPPQNCFNFNGVQLRHVCNWRDPNVQNAQPCAQPHMRVGTHP